MSLPHLALARKWRPQRFEDVIGQRGVVKTLENAITSGRLAQSFIFAGPRGVGKTTTARILARALNCVNGPTAEPCGTCDACVEIAEGRDVDVLEIDGATYTGVDAVREVIVEPLSIAPMRDRYKIFIIDEVHRLSKNAFDALLKSIEEPPPYVKFMMATTDPQNVPDTIKSRSQVFELKTLPFSAIRDQIRTVTTREQVRIDEAAIALVACAAEGSMRDALSALDQVLAFAGDEVTVESVSTVLGLIGRDLQMAIADAVAREDVPAALTLAGTVVESGFDLRIVCRELARLMRDLLVITIDPKRLDDPEVAGESERAPLAALAARYSREDLMRAFDLLSKTEFEIKESSQPRHQFEMALVKWIHLRQLTPLTDLISQAKHIAPAVRVPVAVAPPRAAAPRPLEPPNPGTPEPRNQNPGTTDPKSAILSSIREQNKTLFGMVVQQAQSIEIEGDAVVFTFAPVHKSLRAELERKRGWIEQVAQTAAGRRMKVLVKEGAPAARPPDAAEEKARAQKDELRARAKAQPEVQDMLDVFGGEIEDVEEVDRS
jgi:DNA polymerase-3 subunit gamma/tau